MKNAAHTAESLAFKPTALLRQLNTFAYGTNQDRLCFWLILLNITFLITRPQNDLPFLAGAKITVFIFSLSFICWLPRATEPWTTQMKIMMTLIVVHAFHIFLGWVVWDPMILNDQKAFNGWKDFTQTFLCFMFPLIGFGRYGFSLRRLSVACVLFGCYLGFYGITHSGRGPGGFVGDENDLCLVLAMLLPFSMFLLFEKQPIVVRLLCILGIVLVLGGAVASSSRGGFLGLMCTFIIVFLKSPKKLSLVAFATIFLLLALPYVPQKYWDDMKTIERDASADTGTGRERKDTWAILTRMWLDPQNTIQGVGIDNSPWKMRYYEPHDRGVTKKSLAGRQAHSLYFQLLADMGLIGVFLIGGLIYVSLRDNHRMGKSLKENMALLDRAIIAFDINARRRKTTEKPSEDSRAQETAIRTMNSEMRFLRIFSLMVFSSWIAVLSAGAFISILYYPPIWFLAAITSAGVLHERNLSQLLPLITKNLEETIAADSAAV